ncbi:hypothetical protein BH10PSE1_BH10PSE1_33790 [soil metagenome]
MAPVQLFILFSAFVIFPFAWIRGGHPERAVVATLVLAYASGPLAQQIQWDRLYVGVALVDVTVWGVFVWLSLKYDRWWLFVAAAAQTLNVLASVVLVLTPALTVRENIAAQWAFTLVSLYALLLGVLERRMAGERPAAPSLKPKTRARS